MHLANLPTQRQEIRPTCSLKQSPLQHLVWNSLPFDVQLSKTEDNLSGHVLQDKTSIHTFPSSRRFMSSFSFMVLYSNNQPYTQPTRFPPFLKL
mmetsp:Transcript_17450/g.50861  ORF Transcript_17450/g.50861 Transcript_17450/m.50861 type:complete len:94 (-) Transcript_17450:440-721(-)